MSDFDLVIRNGEAQGYVATLVSGIVINREGVSTGASPGRLVRGAHGNRSSIAA